MRIAVVSDLHSCRYGDGQKGLVEMVVSGRPDVVLMVGDMFDDRLPDGPTQAFVTEMVKRYPCVYVTGNHEFWSDRVFGMMMWMGCPFMDFGTYSPDQHFFPKYANGFYRLANGTPMFVSRGLARESSPVPRFFNHPEVVCIDLMKGDAR